MSKYRGQTITLSDEFLLKDKMRHFLIDLGVIKDPNVLTSQMLSDAISAAQNNFGRPDKMIISAQSLDQLLKSVRFDSKNLKP